MRRRGDQVVSFGDDLSWGPITSVAERVAWLDAECPIPGTWDWLPEAHQSFWEETGRAADERLIWLSDNSSHEMAGYLAYLERFAELPAMVVRPNEHLPPHPKYGRLLGCGTANVEQLADVVDNAERRPVTDDHAWVGRWAELRSENSLLRILQNGQLVSAPIDAYDRLLLAAATSDWQPGVRMVGTALGASFDEQVRVSSDFLFSRLGALIRSGTFEAEGDVFGWDQSGRRTPAMVRKPA